APPPRPPQTQRPDGRGILSKIVRSLSLDRARRAFGGGSMQRQGTSFAGPSATGVHEESEYRLRVRPIAALGLGKGQGASLSVVWIPTAGGEQLPPREARLLL